MSFHKPNDIAKGNFNMSTIRNLYKLIGHITAEGLEERPHVCPTPRTKDQEWGGGVGSTGQWPPGQRRPPTGSPSLLEADCSSPSPPNPHFYYKVLELEGNENDLENCEQTSNNTSPPSFPRFPFGEIEAETKLAEGQLGRECPCPTKHFSYLRSLGLGFLELIMVEKQRRHLIFTTGSTIWTLGESHAPSSAQHRPTPSLHSKVKRLTCPRNRYLGKVGTLP